MKQVKKLLVILPLVALFVLGSLPVLANDPTATLKQNIEAKRVELDNMLKNAVQVNDPAKDAAGVIAGKFAITSENYKTVEGLLPKLAEKELEGKKQDELEGLLKQATAAAEYFKAGVAACPATPGAPEDKTAYTLVVVYHEAMDEKVDGNEATRTYRFPAAKVNKALKEKELPAQIAVLEEAIKGFVESQEQDGYKALENTYRNAAYQYLREENKGKRCDHRYCSYGQGCRRNSEGNCLRYPQQLFCI